MPCFSLTYPSGICSVWADKTSTDEFVEKICDAAHASPCALILTFFSRANFNEQQLSAKLQQQLPDVLSCGCSSSGEVTPDGIETQGAIALLFPASHFCAQSTVLENITELGMDDIVSRVSGLKTALLDQASASEADASDSFWQDVLAVSLIDGLTSSEEAVTSALHLGLGDIPLIGGSAGDDLRFEKTTQFNNGQCFSGGALLILIKSRLSFEVFTNRNFVPTEEKLVITASNPDERKVFEFNAEPAAEVYARALGLSVDGLTPEIFASNPVVIKVGGELYCRAIQRANADGSLSFFCAIDDGIVLTLAKSLGMVASTRAQIGQLIQLLGPIDLILGFDCVLRRLDASNRGVNDSISVLYRDNNVVGFGTYGEQFNSMHLNQTFTGVAFASPGNSNPTRDSKDK